MNIQNTSSLILFQENIFENVRNESFEDFMW